MGDVFEQRHGANEATVAVSHRRRSQPKRSFGAIDRPRNDRGRTFRRDGTFRPQYVGDGTGDAHITSDSFDWLPNILAAWSKQRLGGRIGPQHPTFGIGY